MLDSRTMVPPWLRFSRWALPQARRLLIPPPLLERRSGGTERADLVRIRAMALLDALREK
jgi:hypothetical protein